MESLQDKIDAADGNAARMLRDDPTGPYPFPMPDEYSNWRDEQKAWADTAVLFDQSFHMSDVYFTGPDVKKLFSESGVNNFDSFGKDKAKQFVAVNADGNVIADAICFGRDDNEYILVGTPGAANWVQYRAATGDYDVEVVRDEASPWNPNPRRQFRYQIQGPNGLKIVERAVGHPIDRIKFFNIGTFEIAGVHIRALNHTMIGVPGLEMTGLEMTGPLADGPRVLEALQTAGAEFGMRMGGALAYPTTAVESGWIALPVPAVYTGDSLRSYREWLPAAGFEGHFSLGGSFVSDTIDDYYLTPWDLGYGRVVNFDHEFIGRDAMLQRKDQPHRTKVWLKWNEDDVARVYSSSLFGGASRAKYMDAPNAVYSIAHYDRVDVDGKLAGFSNWTAYTVGLGGWVSLGTIDSDRAIDGAEVQITWGDEDAIGKKKRVEAHKETTVTAVVSTKPLV